MREQTIGTRSNRQSTAHRTRTQTVAQKPARRASKGANKNGVRGKSQHSFDWAATRKHALVLMPLVGKILIVVVLAVLIVGGYRMASAASLFNLKQVDVEGAARSSEAKIAHRVRASLAATGVWRADLDALSAEIARESWVRSAVVSRVLPSGVRVRVTERTPEAAVRTSEGKLMWADADGVLLAPVTPSERTPNFFMRGLDEGSSSSARNENRQRIAAYTQLLNAWQASNIAERVSEVNLDDLRDVRVQLAGRDSSVEVRLGAENFATRLKKALVELDEAKRSPQVRRGATITRIYALDDNRIVIGFSPGSGISRDANQNVELNGQENKQANNRRVG